MGELRSIIGSPSLSSFHAAQRRARAVEIIFDLYACTRQTRHHSANRHALHLSNFAIAKTFQYHQEQGIALVINQRRERTFDIAPARFGSGKVRRSEEHTSELQSLRHLVCRLLL